MAAPGRATTTYIQTAEGLSGGAWPGAGGPGGCDTAAAGNWIPLQEGPDFTGGLTGPRAVPIARWFPFSDWVSAHEGRMGTSQVHNTSVATKR